MIRILLLVVALTTSPLAQAERFSFALFGDTPYSAQERAQLPAILDEMATSGAAFAVHVGDFKSSLEPCSDELFADRLQLFATARLPLIHVPGREQWLDCYRRASGAYSATERLTALRRKFFASAEALGHTGFKLERQSEIAFEHAAFVEHLRWRQGPVLFLSANVPGGDNNWGDSRQGSAEYRARMAAVRDWLERGFALATEQKLRAIVLFVHADPDFEAYAASQPQEAFAELFTSLRAGLAAFPGEVLFVHGDTHVMRIDHPLLDDQAAPIERFRRVETFGSPLMGWIRVEVDTTGEPLFHIHPKPLDGAP